MLDAVFVYRGPQRLKVREIPGVVYERSGVVCVAYVAVEQALYTLLTLPVAV